MQRLLIILGCFLSLDAVCKIIALSTGPNSFLAVHNGVTLLVCFALAIPMAIYMIRVNEKNGKREREDLKPLADKMTLGVGVLSLALRLPLSFLTTLRMLYGWRFSEVSLLVAKLYSIKQI